MKSKLLTATAILANALLYFLLAFVLVWGGRAAYYWIIGA